MTKKIKTYSTHTIIALLAITFPMLISFVQEDNTPKLVGIVISNEKAQFSWTNWFDGSYQSTADDYNSDHWAFKEKMVRLNNQFYYDAFNQLRVNNFVSGKENYVFGEGYIFSAFGDDLVEEEVLLSKLEKARILQDTLKKKGIDLVLGIAPGKGRYCEEYVEDKYKHPVKLRNQEQFVRIGKEKGLNLLDLYTFFLNKKSTTPYPLFTRFGHHWSYYGECLAVDTIIRYLENLQQKNMPNIYWQNIELVDSARSRDADVLQSMNLIRNPDQHMKLAYPQVQFEADTSKSPVKVLVIGDSYWYGPVYLGVSQLAFGYGDFWYYYNRVVPNRLQGEKVEVWQLDFKQEIESNQVIMLMYADGNLPTYGNGFIEDAYELYTSPNTFYARQEKNRLVQTYAKQIREVPALLKKSTLKSENLIIPLDSAIKLDAMRMAGLIVN